MKRFLADICCKKRKAKETNLDLDHEDGDRVGEVSEYEKISEASSKAIKMLGLRQQSLDPQVVRSNETDPDVDGCSASNQWPLEEFFRSLSIQFSLRSMTQRGSGASTKSMADEYSNRDNNELPAPPGSIAGDSREIMSQHSRESTTRPNRDSRDSMTRRTHFDHTQLLFETDFEEMVMGERVKEWAASFRRTDPRYMIMKFFNDIAISGASDIEDGNGVTRSELLSPLIGMFKRSGIFSVWRPTSIDAIRKMMLRRGTGKGLNIKGKSAKTGDLSGYVPFVQIHEENHKKSIKPLSKDAKMRIFYRKWQNRDEAVKVLRSVAEDMSVGVWVAKNVLSSNDRQSNEVGCTKEEAEWRMTWWDADDLSVSTIDNYAKNEGWGPFAKGFGVEISERLFWEAFVCRHDITREAGSEHETGRGSEPAFQDMNFGSTRHWKEGDPRTVVWQHADPKKGHSCMEPRTLLVAYEEHSIVLPVVSDFDCFLLGTRGITFTKELPEQQVGVMKWLMNHIENTLDNPNTQTWSKRWLDVLKKDKPTGKNAQIPRYGYGDPKTYSIMEYAVGRLGENGAIRHGAECFNFQFPQDLDEGYLVVFGDTDGGVVPWKYVSEPELRSILNEKIDQGFTFPMNPKWILTDPGWKEVYDKLAASQRANVQSSLDCWYPPSSGIRQRIEEIYSRHPTGFCPVRRASISSASSDIQLDLDLALEEIRIHHDKTRQI